MENENLFKGIGMVVDDQVNSGKDKAIDGIVKYLENDNHLPLVKYEDLPDNIESICFSSLSFLLLDWELNTLVNVDGSPIPNAALKAQNACDNVDFIKQVVAKVVIPIFIFSNEDVNSIKNTLSWMTMKNRRFLFLTSLSFLIMRKNVLCLTRLMNG